MDRNLVGWFEIPVNDMDRAVKFYNSIFEITLTQMDVLIYFATKDIPKVLSAVTKAGGKVLQEKKQIRSNAYMGLFLDSEGNRIALHCTED